jgi:hypothetical protein
LAVIGKLDLLWLRHFGERETWGTDTHDAITDEIAAALSITRGMADSYLDYARQCGCGCRAWVRCWWQAISITGRFRRLSTAPI